MNLNPRYSPWQLACKRHKLAAFGLVLILSFFSLEQTVTGYTIRFIPDWANSTAGELHLWLAYILLLVPGTILVGYALAPLFERVADHMLMRISALSGNQLMFGLLIYGTGFVLLSLVINRIVFLGFPFTDDEWSVRLGGEVLADGRFMAPLPKSIRALSHAFTYARGGMYTAYDWPGSLFTWALAIHTRLGNALYSVLAGTTACVTVLAAHRQMDRNGALLAMIFLVCSPMFLLISGTTHPQSVSRLFVALTLLGYVITLHRSHLNYYLLTGAAFGLALCFRPIESSALLSPLLAELVWRTSRDKSTRRRLVPLFVAMVIPLALFAYYNLQVTGNILLPPRYGINEMPDRPPPHSRGILAGAQNLSIFLDRFGSNFIYNVSMLAIWWLGPIGALLFSTGCLANRTTKLLSLGVLLALLVTFLHDDLGLHVVGPIHYSEAAIPILFVALYGLQRLIVMTRQLQIAPRDLVAPILASITIACGTLSVTQATALREQAKIHAKIHGIFEHPKFDNSVVIGPPYHAMWQRVQGGRNVGTFVFQWPLAKPSKTDRVVFAHDKAETLSLLKKDFPTRVFFRFQDDGRRFAYTTFIP